MSDLYDRQAFLTRFHALHKQGQDDIASSDARHRQKDSVAYVAAATTDGSASSMPSVVAAAWSPGDPLPLAAVSTDAARVSPETAERERVSGIFAACFAGHEAECDKAIQSGASVAEFKAIIVEKEHAAAALMAAVGLSASPPSLPAAVPKRTSSIAAADRTFMTADRPAKSHGASAADEAAAAALIEAVSFLKH